MPKANSRDSLLYGANPEEGLVAVELLEHHGQPDTMALFFRRADGIRQATEPFAPFMFLERADLLGEAFYHGPPRPLQGGGRLRCQVDFDSWRNCQKAKAWLAKTTGFTANHPGAPYFLISDPAQQHLMRSGRTLFKGMEFDRLHRLQVDIECFTAEGFEFCNAERDEDRIIAIALRDQSGWHQVLSGAELDEPTLLARFVTAVRERDPDVIEGHNIFNFDLPYIATRAARHGVKLTLGRDGSVPRSRPSRFSVGERTLTYTRFDVFGRHIVDTLFLVHAYDISHRSLEGYGLKEVAVHFGIAAQDRTYIEGAAIAAEFKRDPGKVMRYAGHDVQETEALSRILSPSAFVQAQMVPFTYQNVGLRGNATKIDALLLREYLRQAAAVPAPDVPRAFAGGYTDMFMEGVVRDVHHCDVRSLYPSLMLTRQIGPRSDELRVFPRLLDLLRTYRLEAKRAMQRAATEADRTHLDALQATFKVLINSFYGYLGFDQARFSDFDAAERVTADGRALLQAMIAWLRENGAQPVEIDTDGIYFVPPKFKSPDERDRFRADFAQSLPEGIEVEFDGEYVAMYSYKMKNYALLTAEGAVIIKGAALKSRGLEPFQRAFLRDMLRLKLEGQEDRLPQLKAESAAAIEQRRWPIAMFAKTETLQDAPSTYADKIGKGSRGRSATYELALKSGRSYQAGDQISYYVTGARKSVSVHASARLASDWDPAQRDENVAYYLDKLDALYEKFCGGRLGGDTAEEPMLPGTD